MKVNFSQIQHPFTPTELLQEHLKRYCREYGASGREGSQWYPETIGWQIQNEESNEIGFVWLESVRDMPDERVLLMAVYDKYANKDVGQTALEFVEKSLSDLQIKKLRCQVNFNQGMGLIVRKWLYKNCFRLRDRNPSYVIMPETQYIEKHPHPVYFEKNYC